MKYFIHILILTLFPISIFAQYTVTGGSGTPYKYNQNMTGTGVEAIYLLNGLNGAVLSYSTTSTAPVTFYKYGQALASKKVIPNSDIKQSTKAGITIYEVSNITDGYGYLAEVNGALTGVIWIIDYAQHRPSLNSISAVDTDNDCEFVTLLVNKSTDLSFYTVGGIKISVKQEFTISYNTLEWDEDKHIFENKIVESISSNTNSEITLIAPLCDTEFVLSGDQFSKHFGITNTITSESYAAKAVKGYILAQQENSSGTLQSDTIGGSAPAAISFTGYANTPTAYYLTWFIYKSTDLINYIDRYTGKEINYKFSLAGDYVIKLEVANETSTCIDISSVKLNISESELEVPNFFTPLDSPGSNDEFRVKYKSLIRFNCSIFNRWGNKIYQWNDPSKGWDGKYKGKYVNPGVYYYVIEAEGAEGKKYKKSGDINILRGR